MYALSLVSPGWADGPGSEDASLLVAPGSPLPLWVQLGGEPGDRMVLGVCAVWVLGVVLLEGWVLCVEKML